MRNIHHQRSQARRIALQALFQADVQGDDFMVELLPRFIAQATEDIDLRQTASQIAGGAWDYRTIADQWIVRLVPQWNISRIAVVDRSVLRLALWELTRQPDVPPKVALDEAINIAREFSTEESARFVNGVLDAAWKEHLASTGRPDGPTAAPAADDPPK
ncbi:MAG: transcription antitermination factor NusB [Planctomycetes bacterium]|nr:transcription antitermination factor NusB [Planctomycetota bacterium]